MSSGLTRISEAMLRGEVSAQAHSYTAFSTGHPDWIKDGKQPPADTQTTGASLQAMKTAVVCLINQQRTSHGLPLPYPISPGNLPKPGFSR